MPLRRPAIALLFIAIVLAMGCADRGDPVVQELDYDDPVIEERWCNEQRAIVIEYLRGQHVDYREVGDWPAWHVPPYVAIWAVESKTRPGWIGWWVISGDLPTDYISASEIEPPQHPRKAVRAIAERWKLYVQAWKEGRDYEGTQFAPHMREQCAPLLAARSELLLEFTEDDSVWPE